MKNRKTGFLLFSLCVFIFFPASCRRKEPVIYSIRPQIGNMGEPLTIKGANFGSERDISYVTIGGAQPTGTSYLDWRDDEITVRVPEFGEAGLVYAHVKGGKSNGMLYANRATLPVLAPDDAGRQGPSIISITPRTGAIGTTLTITGTGFGNTRGKGGVFFSWDAKGPVSAPAETVSREYINAAESDFGIELWTEREIRVNVPDGAAGGNVEVRTAKGASAPLPVDLSNMPGSKTFGDRRNYTVTVSVNIKTGATEIPNTLYLWVPRPASSPAQRNTEMLSSGTEPFIENYRGTSLFKLENLAPYDETRLSVTWKTDVYAVETSVRPNSVRQEANSPARDAHTGKAAGIPADDARIKNRAAAILGREQNPYIKARLIYDWMLREFDFQGDRIDEDVFTALEKKQADFYTAVLAYCALLRSANIPCQPVAGVLVGRNRQTASHWWAEFWIDGFGWIPVDPVTGAGAVAREFAPEFDARAGNNKDRAEYYFGNIDSRRIAFSRGFTGLSQMDPKGRVITGGRSFSLQNLWEEAVGGIESYSSLWGDVAITGMYTQ